MELISSIILVLVILVLPKPTCCLPAQTRQNIAECKARRQREQEQNRSGGSMEDKFSGVPESEQEVVSQEPEKTEKMLVGA